MGIDTIIGIIAIFFIILFVTTIVIYSCHIINMIDRGKLKSLPNVKENLRNGR